MAKVRSAKVFQYRFRGLPLRAPAIAVCCALALLSIGLAEPSTAVAGWGRGTQVIVALLPNRTPPQALERVPALSPGLLSAGIGDVPAEQTYLDIGQGNRVTENLYDDPLPVVRPRRTRVPLWPEIVERADSVPADLVPGLLAAALKAGRKPIATGNHLVLPALLAADRHGRLLRARTGLGTDRCLAAVCVRDFEVTDLDVLIDGMGRDDLLIAFERPPPEPDHQLTIGIAGAGFDGNLTSDSTRLRGYVLSTDVAPTILERLGLSVPSEMSGEPIRSEGDRDVGAVVSLEDRLAVIVDRRGSVIGPSAVIWIAIAAIVAIASRGSLGRAVVEMLTLSAVYLPLALLVGSALQPSEAVERLILLAGSPLLAALTLILAPGYRGLALACALTTLAFAIDVIAGSPLTRLSLIGSNPGLGVRFFGIGNELEATLTPLVLVGTGAAIAALRPGLAPRRAAAAFLLVAFASAIVFAVGRFGADVGAAIVLPAGAAVAAVALGSTRRTLLLVIAAPLLALAMLALVDLVSGADAHLTRSVLDAGGLHELADVAERRLRLSADSFGRALDVPLLWVAVIGIAIGLYNRDRILGWFSGLPALRAGYLGAAFAVLVATLVNDSGALLLEVGTIYLLLIGGFAWTQAGLGGSTRKAGGRDEPPPRPA